jgi:predicted dehydrogenase
MKPKTARDTAGEPGVRWGVAGPGGIAVRFADAMRQVDGGSIVGVASRSQARADAFAAEHGAARAYGDYETLADDPDVDIVYVATPHARHEHDTLSFIQAGKHVLCEKPLALDAAQARRIADAGRQHGRFVMEAMWSRFLPSYRRLVEVVDSGAIGEVLMVEADFGMRVPYDPAHRLFDPELGGGALLDLGIYPVHLCHLLLGAPATVAAGATLTTGGVDETVAAVLTYESGGLGIIKASLNISTSCTARISGTTGWIEVPAFMHCPQELTVHTLGAMEHIDAGWEGDGLRFELEHVHRCLREQRSESPVMPMAHSIAIAETLDAIRDSIGVVYAS